MRRREFIMVFGGAMTTWPLSVCAQRKTIPVVGYLHGGSPTGRERQVVAFEDGIAETGFVVGRDVVIEYRWAESRYDRLPAMAADLVRRQVAVITAPTLPSALAAKQATGTIPIVFMHGDDPVKHGLADSFNRPGGNATGVSMLTAGLNAKRFGLLRELVPKAALIAVLVNPANPNVGTQVGEVREAARALGQQVEIFEAGTDREIEAAFVALAASQAGGLVVGADPSFTNQRSLILALATRYAIPTIYEWREFVDDGGLASYGTTLIEMYRQVGIYTGKILNGAKSADLPIQQPTKFELVINLKAAKALGLTVPQSILARADEVIE